MQLVNMKRTKSEKEEAKETCCAPSSSSIEAYPYGLEIRLEKESLDKLDLDVDNIAIGRRLTIEATAKITNLNKSISEENNNSSISLQITDMAISVKGNDNPKTLKEALGVLGILKR